MGIHSELSNSLSSKRTRSRHKMARRRVERRVNRGHVGRVMGEVAYPELVSAGMIKKRQKNSRTNVTLSGKKKRKMLKQIKHLQKDKAKMEVGEPSSSTTRSSTDVAMVEVSKKKQTKKTMGESSVSATQSSTDVAMVEVSKKKKTNKKKTKSETSTDVTMEEDT